MLGPRFFPLRPFGPPFPRPFGCLYGLLERFFGFDVLVAAAVLLVAPDNGSRWKATAGC